MLMSNNPNWTICQWIDYCSGPEEEGETQDTPYATRWGCWLDRDNGTVEYARVGDERQAAPGALFPDPLTSAVAISISFDQDAEPVFAIGFADEHIEIRRFVVGVPTTYTFDGITPRLLFNGILLEANSVNSDVVCYYVRNGTIYSRFQRDNFGVEYAATNYPFTVVSIKKVDTRQYRELLYVKRLVNGFFTQNYAIRSPVYPLPPISAEDAGTLESVLVDGRYLDIIVEGGTYSEEVGLNAALTEGVYLDIIVLVSEADAATLDSVIVDGDYVLVVIDGGSYADASTLNAILVSGSYELVVISGGSYADGSTLSSEITGGSYYT